jgi:uncharacterized protein involved in exopolysaccharide biosynthesis
MQHTYNNNPEPRTSNPEPGSSPQSPSLINYLEVIVSRRRMILAITIATTIITAIYAFMLPNIYTAKAKLLPPQQQSGLLSAAMMQGALASLGGELVGESKNARLYSEMLKIESLRDPIIDKFKLKEVYKAKFRQDIYKKLNDNVTIQTGKEGIITISVDDTDPKRSADLANAFVDELKKLTSKMNMTGAGNSRAFLEERIATSRKELNDAENALKSFQSKYKLIDAQAQAGVTMSALTQLNAKLTSQEIQLNILRRTLSESSQEVKNLRQSIAVLRDQISKYEKSGSGVAPGFENVPELGQEYLHLIRSFKTAEAVYDMLTKQYETARLNEANDVSSIQVIQSAIVPEHKNKPQRRKMFEAAFFVSLLSSIALSFAIENISRMDEKTKRRWKDLIKI